MSARLLVLGLLSERPRHGYELHKWLEESQSDRWASVLPGSIYHALRQMQKEGLVDVSATELTGNRARAVYALTAAGAAAVGELLAAAWRAPLSAFPSTLYVLLTFAHLLPAAELRASLEAQLAAIDGQLADWEAGLAAKTEAAALPAWGAALFANGRRHLEADRALLAEVLAGLAG
ncbi:MAG TPA: PadR family transcriptional regulator [Herpetosiphonaceae bacterium]